MVDAAALAPPPRPVPWSLRLQVLGSGMLPLLGWIFLGTEAVLGLTALTALNVHSHLQTEADAARERGSSAGPDVNERLDDWHLALTLSTYGLLGVAALGIGEAQLSFVPEVRTVRERALPEAPKPSGVSVTPRVSGGPGKFELGVAGTF